MVRIHILLHEGKYISSPGKRPLEDSITNDEGWPHPATTVQMEYCQSFLGAPSSSYPGSHAHVGHAVPGALNCSCQPCIFDHTPPHSQQLPE